MNAEDRIAELHNELETSRMRVMQTQDALRAAREAMGWIPRSSTLRRRQGWIAALAAIEKALKP